MPGDGIVNGSGHACGDGAAGTNPDGAGQSCNLTDDLFVDIYNVHGRKAGTRTVPLIDNSFPVSNLGTGVYFLVFTDGKQPIGFQKIVILP